MNNHLLLYVRGHVFMLRDPRAEFKESDKFVLFCNSSFTQVFHYETMALALHGNPEFLDLSPQRSTTNSQCLRRPGQVALRGLRGGQDG